MKRSLLAPVLTVAALLAPGMPLPGQVAEAVDPMELILPVDPALTIGHLDNGLRYYIRVNRRPETRAEIWLILNAGSMQEDDDQLGLAHFVEHMAFNGTRNFEKQELIEYLEGIGMRFGPDVNAFTSFDETVYMLKVPTDDDDIVATAFQILEDWAHGISLEGDEIDKERGVVTEEWRLGRGAEARVLDRQLPVLFKDSRYADRLPIGTPEILGSAPHEALRRFYRDWYRPDLMAVVAIGDFDPDRIEHLIQSHFSRLEPHPNARERVVHPVPSHQATLYSIETDPELTNTTVSIYYKLPSSEQGSIGEYRRSLVASMYNSMLNARLQEVAQRPDPPFLFAYSATGAMVRSADVYFQFAAVEEGGVETGLDALLTEVERVDRHGFTATELDRIKLDFLRGMERAYQERDKRDSDTYAAEYMRHFLEGEPTPGVAVELELYRELLPGITLEEVNTLARKWITEDNRVVLVSGPEQGAESLPDQMRLASTLSGAEGRTIEPYVDRVSEAPLVAEPPTPGAIAASVAIDEVGVTRWELSNGVTVLLKPTDFRNDQILVTGFSPGGSSLVQDENHSSAMLATTLLSEGGLGAMDQVELQKALTGKVASAAAFIGELEEGVRGSASPQDVETLFQLLYLNVTAPRRDFEAVDSLMTRMAAFLQNRLASPDTVFSDEMTRVMTQGHPRRRPPSPELLSEVDLDTAYEVYRDRFADAGDFTFVIVGNFDPEEIRPHVLTYLGGLPANGRQESWKDVGVRPPADVQKVEVRKGLEPKSAVRIVFTGEAPFSRGELHQLDSLASVLRMRLREILREDMGATYGVSVAGSLQQYPYEAYSFSIGFGCAPENVDEMVAALFAEIESLKNGGPGQSYVDKVQEQQTRKRETDLKENGFWVSVLRSYTTNGWPLTDILTYPELVESVTVESLRDAAQRYLSNERYVMGILYPEQTAGT